MNFKVLFLNLIPLVLSASLGSKKEKHPSGSNTDQAAALQFLQDFNNGELSFRNRARTACCNDNDILTQTDEYAMPEDDYDYGEELWKEATSFAWKDFKDTDKTAYRMFKKLSILGLSALSEEKLVELYDLVGSMEDIYRTAKVCAYNASSDENCNLPLELELEEILRSSRNYKELTHVWSQWRDVTGKVMKDKFIRYVQLSNEAAELNGFSDRGEMWRDIYESEDFEEDIEELLQTLKPLYEHLHAYVRQKLRKQYFFSGIKTDGPIPAHLLGNMWGETWGNIYDIVSPYPGKESTDVTEMMKKKKMTPLDMFKMAEEFFTSLGLSEMTPGFWKHSIIVKPDNSDMLCHARAYSNGNDSSIEMCTEVNMEDLMTIHHEMGHVEYYLHYENQHPLFRQGANPGFHEAVGDAIALSARTPEHLKKIGLLEEVVDDKEVEINTLLRTALDTLAFIPFGYLVDAWRWKVFDGSISEDELNQKWWEMRLQYQGLCPPVRRTNKDLDPAAKFHVASDIPYIRYFVAFIIQFQFHKSLCNAAGHQGPLHKCDIYNSKEAGKLLSEMLSKGSSEHWEEAMSTITDGKYRKVDATPMIEYFTPLIDWLKEQNKNETLGWKSSDPMICP